MKTKDFVFGIEQCHHCGMIFPRRRFLQTASGAFAVVTGAAGSHLLAVTDPYPRSTPGNFIPGLSAYSFRSSFRFMKGKENKKRDAEHEMDMIRFIRFCAANGVSAELTSYFFPPGADQAFFTQCRKTAHLHGVVIAGTAVGNQFTLDRQSPEAADQMTYVKEWIDRSVWMGAPHVRVFAGRIPKGMEESVAEKNAIAALEEAADYASKKGVFLGLENHDSIGSAEKLLAMVRAVKSPWLGINLDSGNFRTDDPYADFAECVPYTVNVQLKTSLHRGGKREPSDFAKLFGILREKGYSGHVVLEYEDKDDPFAAIPPLLDQLKSLSAV